LEAKWEKITVMKQAQFSGKRKRKGTPMFHNTLEELLERESEDLLRDEGGNKSINDGLQGEHI
jgi:hypothetical protein